MTTKKCTRCKKIKDIEEFHKKWTFKDERRSICKECGAIAYSEYRQKNLEKIRLYDRERIKNTETKEYRKKYRLNNREKELEYQKNWNAKNKLKRQEICARHHRSAKGIYKTLINNFLRGRKVDIKMTRGDFIEWYNYQNKVCHYCDIKEEDLQSYEKEMGGNIYTKRLTIDRKNNDECYTVENICLSCMRCNIIKGSFFTEQEMKEIAEKYVKHRWNKKAAPEQDAALEI